MTRGGSCHVGLRYGCEWTLPDGAPPHGEVWASLDKKEQAALLDPVVKPLIEAGRGGSPRGAGRTNKAQLSVSLTMVQAANAKRLAELDGKKKDFIQLLKAAC